MFLYASPDIVGKHGYPYVLHWHRLYDNTCSHPGVLDWCCTEKEAKARHHQGGRGMHMIDRHMLYSQTPLSVKSGHLAGHKLSNQYSWSGVAQTCRPLHSSKHNRAAPSSL